MSRRSYHRVLLPEVLDDIDAHRAGPAWSADQLLAARYVERLLEPSGPSAESLAEVRARWGNAGAVDLAGIAGYYSMMAMTLNAFRILPQDQTTPAERPGSTGREPESSRVGGTA